MSNTEDFYKKYKIDEFYLWQAQNTKQPIQPFIKSKHKKLSHGILPGYRNYDLFYERYLSAVKLLQANNFIKDNIRVLDVGSGEAFFKFFFDALCPEKIAWHGVEVWKERAAFCRHVGYEIKETTLENGQLPYDSDQFDIVLASHVIEHLPNPATIIQEIARVTKKAGAMVFGTPTKPPGIAQLDSWYHRISNRQTGDTQQAFTHHSLEKMILKATKLPTEKVIDKRGFRIISGRKKLPIENWKWFYELSTYLGRNWLFLVPEVNIIVRKE